MLADAESGLDAIADVARDSVTPRSDFLRSLLVSKAGGNSTGGITYPAETVHMSHARRDNHARNAWQLVSLIFRPAQTGISSLHASGISGLHDQEFVLPDRNLVLVVDDDPGTLKGVQRLLRQHGYDSMLFPSVEAFENHRGIDKAVCVILDINLGDGSGIELRHRLKARGHSVPVIFMTANDDPAVRTAALASGCLAFLTKPFAAKSLIEPIAKAAALA